MKGQKIVQRLSTLPPPDPREGLGTGASLPRHPLRVAHHFCLHGLSQIDRHPHLSPLRGAISVSKTSYLHSLETPKFYMPVFKMTKAKIVPSQAGRPDRAKRVDNEDTEI